MTIVKCFQTFNHQMLIQISCCFPGASILETQASTLHWACPQRPWQELKTFVVNLLNCSVFIQHQLSCSSGGLLALLRKCRLSRFCYSFFGGVIFGKDCLWELELYSCSLSRWFEFCQKFWKFGLRVRQNFQQFLNWPKICFCYFVQYP